MAFEVSRDTEQPKIQNDGMKYEGLRFRAECRLAGKLYGQAFGAPRSCMHTRCHVRAPNTRIKDLPDIALLATTRPLEAVRLRSALERTFEFRATHSIPSSLPYPPANWSIPYREMARANELAWTTLEQLTTAVTGFINPLLDDSGGIWRPVEWKWQR
jgi:hypothetical protein